MTAHDPQKRHDASLADPRFSVDGRPGVVAADLLDEVDLDAADLFDLRRFRPGECAVFRRMDGRAAVVRRVA
jgi:hypothetical protein